MSYGDALHGAALATISGEPLEMDGALAKTLEVVLALYAVVLFAALAGSIGAFFLHPSAPPPITREPLGTNRPDQVRRSGGVGGSGV